MFFHFTHLVAREKLVKFLTIFTMNRYTDPTVRAEDIRADNNYTDELVLSAVGTSRLYLRFDEWLRRLNFHRHNAPFAGQEWMYSVQPLEMTHIRLYGRVPEAVQIDNIDEVFEFILKLGRENLKYVRVPAILENNGLDEKILEPATKTVYSLLLSPLYNTLITNRHRLQDNWFFNFYQTDKQYYFMTREGVPEDRKFKYKYMLFVYDEDRQYGLIAVDAPQVIARWGPRTALIHFLTKPTEDPDPFEDQENNPPPGRGSLDTLADAAIFGG